MERQKKGRLKSCAYSPNRRTPCSAPALTSVKSQFALVWVAVLEQFNHSWSTIFKLQAIVVIICTTCFNVSETYIMPTEWWHIVLCLFWNTALTGRCLQQRRGVFYKIGSEFVYINVFRLHFFVLPQGVKNTRSVLHYQPTDYVRPRSHSLYYDQPAHSLFQSEFFTRCDLVLPLAISSIFLLS